jgi:hypothetical protein
VDGDSGTDAARRATPGADYWAPVVLVPKPQPLVAAAPPRRPGRTPTAVMITAAVVVAGGLAVVASRAQAVATGQVIAVSEPAESVAGWGPTYVDEQGLPARWDPCVPISYVIQPGWIPDAGRADLDEALSRLTAASGLQFSYEGDTDEMPSAHRQPYQPARYGERWAPLLIGWVPPEATDLGIGAGAQGLSLSVAVPGRGGPSLVSGQVVLDASNRLASGFGAGTTDGEVLLHELAHAVGLGHVLDPTQVMYPQTTNSESQFGAGDRAGLAAVGAPAGCHPVPRARSLRLSAGP